MPASTVHLYFDSVGCLDCLTPSCSGLARRMFRLANVILVATISIVAATQAPAVPGCKNFKKFL